MVILNEGTPFKLLTGYLKIGVLIQRTALKYYEHTNKNFAEEQCIHMYIYEVSILLTYTNI